MKDNEENEENEEEKKDTTDVFEFRYNMIINSIGNGDMMVELINKKADFLLKFVQDNKRVPMYREKVDDVNIGRFWDNIKQGHNSDIYKSQLSKNLILFTDYEKTKKIKEEKKGKEISMEDKANLLLKFVQDNKRVPMYKEMVDNFNIGRFWKSIKQGHNSDIYKSQLSTNLILSTDYEKTQKSKEISMEDKANLLLDFVQDNKRVPKYREKVDNFNIGSFWNNIKQAQNSDIYKSQLSTNLILSANYEKTQKDKKKKKKL